MVVRMRYNVSNNVKKLRHFPMKTIVLDHLNLFELRTQKKIHMFFWSNHLSPLIHADSSFNFAGNDFVIGCLLV